MSKIQKIILIGIITILSILVFNLTKPKSAFQYCFDKCFDLYDKYSPDEGTKLCIEKCK